MTNHKSAFAPLSAIVVGAFFSLGFIGTASAAPSAPSVEIRNFYSAWVSTQSYRAGSVVTFNGASYICLVKNRGVAPNKNTGDWAILDAPGATGPQGPMGSAGARGPAGPTGPQGPAGALPMCTAPDVAVLYNGTFICKSAIPHFTANGDGTLTDNQTGLMWEIKTTTCSGEVTCYTNAYNWSGSGSAADGRLFEVFIAELNGGDYYSPSAGQVVSAGPRSCFANHCDWRIPTLAELLTIANISASGCSSPCIDPAFGPTQPGDYWSSSAVEGNPNNAWYVDFLIGDPGTFFKRPGAYARAVRRGR